MVEISTLYTHLKNLNKQWFYEKDEIDEGFVAKSNTQGLLKNDGTVDTSTYLVASDISGKANSADLATVATSGEYTDLENIPETFAPSSHNHPASEVTDTTAYSNLGTSSGATQHAINTAINNKIGDLLSVELITVVSNLGTASASTMNKLYLVAEATTETNDAYEIYVTVETEDEVEQGEEQTYSYDWERVDTARINLTNYSLATHTHGNITSDGKIGSNANYFVTTTTGGAVTSQEKVGNINTDGKIGTDSGKVVVTTTNGVLTTSNWVDEVDAVIQTLYSYGENL